MHHAPLSHLSSVVACALLSFSRAREMANCAAAAEAGEEETAAEKNHEGDPAALEENDYGLAVTKNWSQDDQHCC